MTEPKPATSSASSYFIQLDGLRAAAICAVMFGHWMLNLPAMVRMGEFAAFGGVNLFFVLSGFLITGIFLKNKADATHSNGRILRQFYVRRFLRIFPLYYLVVFGGLLVNMPGARENAGWLLLYVANWKALHAHGTLQAYLHLWSLSVEEQFYIVFPLLLLLIHRNHIKQLAVGFILIGVLSRLAPYLPFIKNADWGAAAATNSCLDALGAGVLLAWLFANYKTELHTQLSIHKWLYIVPVVIAAFGYAYLPLDGMFNTVSFRLLTSLSSFWLVGMAAFGDIKGWARAVLQNRAVVYLGRISYGLYVYHFFMPFIYSRLSFTNTQNVIWVMITAMLFFFSTLMLSVLSFHFFEKPITNLKRYFEYQ